MISALTLQENQLSSFVRFNFYTTTSLISEQIHKQITLFYVTRRVHLGTSAVLSSPFTYVVYLFRCRPLTATHLLGSGLYTKVGTIQVFPLSRSAKIGLIL